VEALLTTSELDPDSQPHWNGGVPSIFDVPYEDAVPLVPRLPNEAPVSIMEQVEVRLDPSANGFTTGTPAGRGELRGWLQLPHGDPFNAVSLLYAVDAFPPATF